jgi:hypothetical protein
MLNTATNRKIISQLMNMEKKYVEKTQDEGYMVHPPAFLTKGLSYGNKSVSIPPMSGGARAGAKEYEKPRMTMKIGEIRESPENEGLFEATEKYERKLGGRRFRHEEVNEMSVTRDFKGMPSEEEMYASNLTGGAILYSGGKKEASFSKTKSLVAKPGMKKAQMKKVMKDVEMDRESEESEMEGGKKHKPKGKAKPKTKAMSPAQNNYREQIKKIMATGKTLKEALIYYKNNKK